MKLTLRQKMRLQDIEMDDGRPQREDDLQLFARLGFIDLEKYWNGAQAITKAGKKAIYE